MTTIATSTLYAGTINGLNSLDLDTLQVTDLNTTNIDGNYFSINTIEVNDIQVDNELELTLNGFITIGKNTPEEITITDTQIGYLDGVTSNIQNQINSISIDTTDLENRITTAEGEIDLIQTDIISLESNVVNLQNKTQRFDTGGNINQAIVIAGLINSSGQELRINRINFYQQPVGLPELVIATLRANSNKSINNLYLNTYTNDLDILSNQININCDIKFNDNSIQTTAFTDVLKQKVLDNETNITNNTTDIATNTSNIATNTTNISTNTSNISTNTSNIATNTSNITTLQNKTQRFDTGGNINQAIVIAGLINSSAQELRINRINFYQQPVGLPELVIATLRANSNKSINNLYLNTYTNDLDILSNQININCDIKFNDNSIQTTAFTDVLKQKVLDNETNITNNTTDIATNTSNIATNTTNISTNTSNIATNTSNIATNTSNISINTSNIATNTSNISTNTSNITTNSTNITTNATNITTLQNKTQKFDAGGNIVSGIIVAAIINASAQEIRINRINFYQQPVGQPELVIATLRSPTNKAINDLELNTYTNDLNVLSNQININCDIKFNDNSIQTTAFTDVLNQKILDNETNIATNTTDIATNTADIATLYQSLVPVGTIIITAQPLTIAPPTGYDFCIGTLKSTTGKYAALYALIGNTYQGNKPSYTGNFYLPDLRQVYIKGSGQSNTYTTSSLPTSTGQYQQQSVQQHKHDYEVPANTNNVTSTSADNRSVYDNTRITTQTTTLRDKNNITIPASLDETRPDTISLNYLIKY